MGGGLETGHVVVHSGLTENGQGSVAFRAEQEECGGMDRTHTNRKQKKILLDYLHLEFLTSFLGPLPQVLPFLTAFFISPEAWVYSSPTVSGAAGITCPKYNCLPPSATNI